MVQPSYAPLPPSAGINPCLLPKRKRGGQLGNQNARKCGTFSRQQPGPLSDTLARLRLLECVSRYDQLPLDQLVAGVLDLIKEFRSKATAAKMPLLAALRLEIKISSLLNRLANLSLPAILRQRALRDLAADPIGWIQYWRAGGRTCRDADSFFPVSEKSARNSPLPPGHPTLATNLTDEQWAVLAPLIPPDPHLDWLTGQPPVIIAANRWRFTRYVPGSEFDDFVIMDEYARIIQRMPALAAPRPPGPPARKRGRPHAQHSPRALLDAIIWKLATGHTWSDLPAGFPPSRLCRRYYRRLFRSGRLYTLLLALYNYMDLEADLDLSLLVEQGVFTTTPGQKIALSPGVPPTWRNYTALLFMQLARHAYSRAERECKERDPWFELHPVFKGADSLSTALLPGVKPQPPPLTFEPLEQSFAWRKWRKIEQQEKLLNKLVQARIRSSARK